MAALVANQALAVYSSTDGVVRTDLYAVKNVTTGDTLDVSKDFSSVKRAVVISETSAAAAPATAAGATLTFPAGLAGDGAWLLVVGVTAWPLAPV